MKYSPRNLLINGKISELLKLENSIKIYDDDLEDLFSLIDHFTNFDESLFATLIIYHHKESALLRFIQKNSSPNPLLVKMFFNPDCIAHLHKINPSLLSRLLELQKKLSNEFLITNDSDYFFSYLSSLSHLHKQEIGTFLLFFFEHFSQKKVSMANCAPCTFARFFVRCFFELTPLLHIRRFSSIFHSLNPAIFKCSLALINLELASPGMSGIQPNFKAISILLESPKIAGFAFKENYFGLLEFFDVELFIRDYPEYFI